MIPMVSAIQLDQSILAIWCWSTLKVTMDALEATRYCFASVNQRMMTVKGELLLGSFSFFALGDTVCGSFLFFSRLRSLTKPPSSALGEP
jgi:hypothetical protein